MFNLNIHRSSPNHRTRVNIFLRFIEDVVIIVVTTTTLGHQPAGGGGGGGRGGGSTVWRGGRLELCKVEMSRFNKKKGVKNKNKLTNRLNEWNKRID